MFDQIQLAQGSIFMYAGLPVFSEWIIEEGYTRVYYRYIHYTILYYIHKYKQLSDTCNIHTQMHGFSVTLAVKCCHRSDSNCLSHFEGILTSRCFDALLLCIHCAIYVYLPYIYITV
jgi:hypothetical protein